MSTVLLSKLVNAIESGASGIELASLVSEARVYLDIVESEKYTHVGSNFDRNEFGNWLASVMRDRDGVKDDSNS